MNGDVICGTLRDYGIHQMVIPKMANLSSNLLWITMSMRPSLTKSRRM